ncbi:MAG: rane-anchored mycosin [Pseudonocardiales bacterium]|nr:rane-anchored mycosin [Pseudonocardiales bacterium]
MRSIATMLGLLLAALSWCAPAAATPGPADAPEYWFDEWQVPQLWQSGARGQGITIAEIDTGVNATLPELRGRILPGHDFGGAGNGQVDRQVDTFGHGTAMASIMVARPGVLGITGMAPAARVLPIAVPLGGTTTENEPDEVPAAIRYAADHGAQIISMSLGGKRQRGVDAAACPDEEQTAIYHALRKGALVIASVGNTGPTENTVEDPGVCLGVISVGATDASDQVASFSAREPYLTLVAPGVNIPTLGRIAGQAFSGEGTSQSTALTSATAALVWSAHPDLDARGVATRLLNTLDHPRTRADPAYGFGELNAYRAVTEQVAAGAPNPVFDAVEPFLGRLAALNRAAPAAPPPAATGAGSTGRYAVGSLPWLTPQVALGIALAGAGLVLLAGSGYGLRLVPAGRRPPRPGAARRPRPRRPRPVRSTARARPQRAGTPRPQPGRYRRPRPSRPVPDR